MNLTGTYALFVRSTDEKVCTLEISEGGRLSATLEIGTVWVQSKAILQFQREDDIATCLFNINDGHDSFDGLAAVDTFCPPATPLILRRLTGATRLHVRVGNIASRVLRKISAR